MKSLMIIFTALLPVAILVGYIYRKDKYKPEPTGQLIKAFFWGVLSVFVSFGVSVPLQQIGLFPAGDATTIGESIRIAFFGAAIPEELAKLFVLWLFLRRNSHFDEKMDGIVYAVCVSLGFAALENLSYLISDADSFLSIGIARALTAVPGHCCFGIIMGYYYSLAKFCPKGRRRNKVLTYVAPVVVHGLYDSILFVISVTPVAAGLLMIVFLVFCYKMWKYAGQRIKEHLARDFFDAEVGADELNKEVQESN